MGKPSMDSMVVWFYYDGIADAARFYGDLLRLELALDEGWARIYKMRDGAFVGMVDASSGRGSCSVVPDSAVLLTLVVDDIEAWFSFLKSEGVAIEGEIRTSKELEVQSFFLRDPGGYALEIQKFTNPETAKGFRLPSQVS